jgi:hypothetical protein
MDIEYLKKTYSHIAESYPKVFDYDQWVGFSVTRSTSTHTRPESPNTKFHNAGPVLYVKASPGNGTEYRFFLIQGEIPGFPDDRMMLAFDPDQRWGNMWLKDFHPHPNYLIEKLGMGEADAVALAVILGRLDGGR